MKLSIHFLIGINCFSLDAEFALILYFIVGVVHFSFFFFFFSLFTKTRILLCYVTCVFFWEELIVFLTAVLYFLVQ